MSESPDPRGYILAIRVATRSSESALAGERERERERAIVVHRGSRTPAVRELLLSGASLRCFYREGRARELMTLGLARAQQAPSPPPPRPTGTSANAGALAPPPRLDSPAIIAIPSLTSERPSDSRFWPIPPFNLADSGNAFAIASCACREGQRSQDLRVLFQRMPRPVPGRRIAVDRYFRNLYGEVSPFAIKASREPLKMP
jgi:hypothetical protein